MSYKKYASDYRLEESLTPRGKVQTKRIYQGVYYRFRETPEAVRSTGKKVLAGSVICCLLLLPTLFTANDLGRTFYVVLPVAAAFVPLYLLLAAARRLLTGESPFTREHRDKTDKRLRSAGVCLPVFLGIAFIGSIVYIILNGCAAGELGCIVCLGLAWLVSGFLMTLRRRAETEACEPQ